MTTTAVPATTAHRRALTGLVGGALWALLPVAWALVSLDDVEYGTLPWLGVIASYWILAVLPPALIVVGLTALRRSLGNDTGRAGRIGIAVATIGLGAMSLGMGTEVASFTAGGGEVALGHALFLIGFLVAAVGSILVGVVVFRRRRDGLSRAAGLVLALAIPLGIGIGALGSAIVPGNDGAFFAAISVPTGIAWVLLGRSLTSTGQPAAREYAAAS